MVDVNGKTGWAPASFLVPVEEEGALEEAQDDFEDDPTPGIDRCLSRAIAAVGRAVTLLHDERLRRVVMFQSALAQFHQAHGRFPSVSLE